MYTICVCINCYITIGSVHAQCPPNVTSVFIFNDRPINLPLTTPFCLACRFVNTMTGMNFQFNDGIWTNEGATLTNGGFNGNVTLTSTDDTMAITLTYPATVISVGNQLRCSSVSVNRQHIITVGAYGESCSCI